MVKAKEWARSLHIGQLVMLSVMVAGVSCASGLRAFVVATGADGCTEQTAYQDSVASNRARLKSSDSVLRRFDLSQAADPLFRLKALKAAKTGTDTARALAAPNIERNVVALRAQGADPKDLAVYLGVFEMLDENLARFTPDSANRQIATIHRREADSLYMAYVRETTEGEAILSKYTSHDTTRLSVAAREARSRCVRYRFELPFDLAVWLVSLTTLFAAWWWWFGGRRT